MLQAVDDVGVGADRCFPDIHPNAVGREHLHRRFRQMFATWAADMFRYSKSETPEIAVVVGENSTALLIDALVEAGLFPSGTAQPKHARNRVVNPRLQVVRVATWDTAVDTAASFRRCIAIAQMNLVPPQHELRDANGHVVDVACAETLIAQALSRHQRRVSRGSAHRSYSARGRV